jgi:O-antigen ligase
LLRGRQWLLAPLIVAALPFRVPLEAGGERANLLVPLYLVIAGGVLAAFLREARPSTTLQKGSDPGNEFATVDTERARPVVWLRGVLAAFVLLYAVQALYSEDPTRGLQNVCFFFVPFSLVFALLADLRWDRRALVICAGVAAAEALLFALVGLGEYVTGELFWNDGVKLANQFHTYFRVNSFFWDPNILGRYLALVSVIAMAVLLWTKDLRRIALLAAFLGVLMLALAVTYSQSSYVALLAGLAVLAALRWSLRWTAAVVALPVLAVLALGIHELATSPPGQNNKDTGGRLKLVEGGWDLFTDRPVWGYGSGSFSKSYEEHVADRVTSLSESHTEPVTVGAEQGLIGFAAYLALLAVAVWVLVHRIGPLMPGVTRGPPDPDAPDWLRVGRAAVLASFTALVVHSLSYAGFFEDPITWVLLAVGSALAAGIARPGRAD